MRPGRLPALAVIAAFSVFGFPVAVGAIDYPLTDAQAQDALAGGLKVPGINLSTMSAFDEWTLESDPGASAPTGVFASIETPYSFLYRYAALQGSRYQQPDPEVVRELLHAQTISVSILVMSKEIHANDAARIVIRQGTTIIQPTKNVVTQTRPTDLFWQHVDADFDPRKIDLTQPFTVILAAVEIPPVQGPYVHEIHYTVDPSRFR